MFPIDLSHLRFLSQQGNLVSLRAELMLDIETPISAYAKLCHGRPYSFLFESAEVTGASGRYSFIGFDPLEVFTFEQDGALDPLEVLRSRLRDFQLVGEGCERFEAGLVGYFSYEAIRHFERISIPATPAACAIPEAVFFLPRVMLVFDHLRHTVTLHVLMSLEGDMETNLVEAEQVGLEVLGRLETGVVPRLEASEGLGTALDEPHSLMPSSSDFQAQVERAKEAILEGEVFQVVLSHSMTMKTDKDPLELYRLLRRTNPSPYMFLMNFEDFSVVGASPETLVRVENGEVLVKPIAGTRPRGATLQDDIRLERELLADSKERAEHMMLVDLGRNDVGRVCEGGSVHVTSLAQVERFSTVMHLVSEVRGRVRDEVDVFEVFQSCFPAGTLTGAPKLRACELIAELEGRRRGLYGGAVGYFGLNGSMDFAIAIRTLVHRDDTVYVQAGAGIVYDSIPHKEHQECLHKATACLSIV